MKKLNELFEATYGNKFDFNKMKHLPRSRGGVNFVGRSSKNNGVSGTVAPLPGVEPYAAGVITVALGGSKLLSAFVQEDPFYTAQNVAVLKPKDEMSFAEKLFACLCIRHNRFRYSAFGREANRTLRELLIPSPSEFPNWLREVSSETLESKLAPANTGAIPPLNPAKWKPVQLSEIFDIKKGKRLTKARMTPGLTPFVGAVAINNGIVRTIGQAPIHAGNTISVPYNGSVGEAFFQPSPYCASDDVNVLYPRFQMTPAIGLFIATIIRQEKYRFNYGRKWHKERMEISTIRLPCKGDCKPDWKLMERFILSLPFSSQLSNA